MTTICKHDNNPKACAGLWTRFVCWFSARYFDIHDYKESWGGDGTPSHFYTYTCWNCGKEFTI